MNNRTQSTGKAALVGCGVGVVVYLICEALTPRNSANAGDHDIALAIRLGFIYTAATGIWLGWLQRSWRRVGASLISATFIGIVYMQLCATRNFFAIQVSFPCLLGGALSGALGSNRSHWASRFPLRFGKGLLAGVTLGFVYMFTLGMGADMVMDRHFLWTDPQYVVEHVRMMWRVGPIALGIASAFFFPLIRWATDLRSLDELPQSKSDLPTLNVPEVLEVPASLEADGIIEVADFLVTKASQNRPSLIEAELIKDEQVIWHLKKSGEIPTEIYRSERPAEFRALLARFGFWYLGSQMYGGYVRRALNQNGNSCTVRIYMSNEGASGFWIRIYAA